MPLLDLQQHLKQELETNPFLELVEPEEEEEDESDRDRGAGRRAQGGRAQRRDRLGRDPARGVRHGRPSGGARGKGVLRAGHRGDARPERPPDRSDRAARPLAAASWRWPRSSSAISTTRAISSCPVQEIVDGINAEIARIAEESGRDDAAPLPVYTVEEGEAHARAHPGSRAAGRRRARPARVSHAAAPAGRARAVACPTGWCATASMS